MANRYWVGGTADWDATAGTKWSTTSGGAGGSAVPTSSDDVFVDAASGSGTLTVTISAVCKSINFTGYTGTLAGGTGIAVSGSITLGAGMTNSFGGSWQMKATGSLTTNGVDCTGTFQVNSGAVVTLQDNFLSSNGTFTLLQGTINANNFNMNVYAFSSDNSNVRTITMGSGTWTMSGGNFDITTITNLTFNADTSTLKFIGNTQSLINGTKNFYNVWFSGSSANTKTITGNFNVLNDLTDDITVAHTLVLPSVIVVSGFTYLNGHAGQLLTMSSTTNIQSSRVVASDYLNLSNSTASGGGTFYAGSHSTNSGGNSGWSFTSYPPTNFPLTAAVGTFTLTGFTLGFLRALHIVMSVGSFILTGKALAFERKWNNLVKQATTWVNKLRS